MKFNLIPSKILKYVSDLGTGETKTILINNDLNHTWQM